MKPKKKLLHHNLPNVLFTSDIRNKLEKFLKVLDKLRNNTCTVYIQVFFLLFGDVIVFVYVFTEKAITTGNQEKL